MQLIAFFRALAEKLGVRKSSTQRSAYARHESTLKNYEVLERSKQRDQITAAVKMRPEALEELSSDEMMATAKNAQRIRGFFLEYLGGDPEPNWTLEQLDEAYGAWTKAENKGLYSPEAVVAIVGAAFGEYCVQHLEMKWIHIRDADGHAIAIQSLTVDVRGFPYSTISKRIANSEYGFFRPVFNSLRESIASAKHQFPGA